MMRFNMRKTVAVLAAVATLGVAGPVAVTAAQAADAPAASQIASQITVDFKYTDKDGTVVYTTHAKGSAGDAFSVFERQAAADEQAPSAELPGYKVTGWTDGASVFYAPGSTDPVAGSVDLYPAREADPAADLATVTFKYTNKDGSVDEARTTAVTLDKGKAFSEFAKQTAAPTLEGYRFTGWTDYGTVFYTTADTTPVEGDLTLYSAFETDPAANQATVTFNGISAATGYKKAVTLEAGSKLSAYIDRVSGLLPTPPAGYELAYYTVNDKGEKTRIYPSDPVKQDVTVSVEYAAQTVKVTFYMDENSAEVFGNKDGEDAVKGVTTLGELTKRIGTPAKPGKVFAGWHGVGTDVLDPSVTFDRDTALTASWKDAAVNHTVTFSAWANVDGKVSFNDGKTHRFHEYQDALKYEVQVPRGYDFAGWSQDANHKDVDHLVDSLMEVTADIEVFPVFVKSATEQPVPAKVNVAFHDNKGNVIANIDGTSGDSFDAFTAKLAARNITAPAVPGQEFVAWSVKGGAATPEIVTGDLDVYPAYKATPKPQPQYPWWAGWWGSFQHWWGSWNQWFGSWWR